MPIILVWNDYVVECCTCLMTAIYFTLWFNFNCYGMCTWLWMMMMNGKSRALLLLSLFSFFSILLKEYGCMYLGLWWLMMIVILSHVLALLVFALHYAYFLVFGSFACHDIWYGDEDEIVVMGMKRKFVWGPPTNLDNPFFYFLMYFSNLFY